jgi:peptidoglycan/LPS O-acetylase OafA/YrhL
MAVTERARGLDGLRAIAVSMVVVFHLNEAWLPGGFVGVDVFFVISGYLITDLLTVAYEETGRIRLVRFWGRRARRLLPALFAVLLVVCAAAVAIGDVSGLKGNLLAALTYTSNWYLIGTQSDYFAQLGPPGLLKHLWSAAVEEQFYLIWPLAMLLILRMPRERRKGVTAVLAVASALAMAIVSYHNVSRAYYGTDTHAFGLFIGATLAFCLPLRSLLVREWRRTPALLGAGGLVVLFATAVFFNGNDPLVYRGGLVLVALSSVAVIVAAVVPGPIARLLTFPPLRWIGTVSYGIYIWHWPVIALTTAVIGLRAERPVAAVIEATAAVLLAAASWWWLEEPIRRHGFAAVRDGFEALCLGFSRDGMRRTRVAAVFVLVALILTTGSAAYVLVRPAVPQARGSRLIQQILQGEKAARQPAPSRDVRGTPRVHRRQAARIAGSDITAIGDSVMLASAVALRSAFPGIAIDAVVGRQMDAAAAAVDELRQEGELHRVVVVGLGTNGPFSMARLRQVLRDIGPGHRVVLVNTWAPRSWTDGVNRMLARAARARPGVVLADWHDAIAPHKGLLWDDDVHPRPNGAHLYVGVIRHAVRSAEGSPSCDDTVGS